MGHIHPLVKYQPLEGSASLFLIRCLEEMLTTPTCVQCLILHRRQELGPLEADKVVTRWPFEGVEMSRPDSARPTSTQKMQ